MRIYFTAAVLIITAFLLVDEGGAKLVNKVRHKKKPGGGRMGGGGKGGGKGGSSGGPAWLNRKPWETDLWKELTTSATTTDADYVDGTTTFASYDEAEPIEPFKPMARKRTDVGFSPPDTDEIVAGSMEEEEAAEEDETNKLPRKEFINAATGLKCNAGKQRFKHKCKAINKIFGRECTTVFYNIDATNLQPSDEVCCRAWGCEDLKGECEKLSWQDIGCVQGSRGGEMEQQIGWGKVKQRPRLRCNITPDGGVVRWGYRAIHNDQC